MTIYSTRQEAEEAKSDMEYDIYYTHKGEYAPPTYKVRKVRDVDGYYIRVEYHYYQGEIGAPKNRAL